MKITEIPIKSLESFLAKKYKFVTAAEWAVLDSICKPVILKKGDVFLLQGKAPRQCAFIQEGIVKYSYMSSERNESVLHFAFDTDYVSDCESYQNNLPGSFSVVALTTTRLLVIDNRKLDAICQQQPGLMKLCLKLSHNIIFQQSKRVRLLSGNTPMYRYKMALEFFPDLVKKISSTEIAKYINVSREAVSRVRLQVVTNFKPTAI